MQAISPACLFPPGCSCCFHPSVTPFPRAFIFLTRPFTSSTVTNGVTALQGLPKLFLSQLNPSLKSISGLNFLYTWRVTHIYDHLSVYPVTFSKKSKRKDNTALEDLSFFGSSVPPFVLFYSPPKSSRAQVSLEISQINLHFAFKFTPLSCFVTDMKAIYTNFLFCFWFSDLFPYDHPSCSNYILTATFCLDFLLIILHCMSQREGRHF